MFLNVLYLDVCFELDRYLSAHPHSRVWVALRLKVEWKSTGEVKPGLLRNPRRDPTTECIRHQYHIPSSCEQLGCSHGHATVTSRRWVSGGHIASAEALQKKALQLGQ